MGKNDSVMSEVEKEQSVLYDLLKQRNELELQISGLEKELDAVSVDDPNKALQEIARIQARLEASRMMRLKLAARIEHRNRLIEVAKLAESELLAKDLRKQESELNLVVLKRLSDLAVSFDELDAIQSKLSKFKLTGKSYEYPRTLIQMVQNNINHLKRLHPEEFGLPRNPTPEESRRIETKLTLKFAKETLAKLMANRENVTSNVSQYEERLENQERHVRQLENTLSKM